jgi:hypothetical protein
MSVADKHVTPAMVRCLMQQSKRRVCQHAAACAVVSAAGPPMQRIQACCRVPHIVMCYSANLFYTCDDNPASGSPRTCVHVDEHVAVCLAQHCATVLEIVLANTLYRLLHRLPRTCVNVDEHVAVCAQLLHVQHQDALHNDDVSRVNLWAAAVSSIDSNGDEINQLSHDLGDRRVIWDMYPPQLGPCPEGAAAAGRWTAIWPPRKALRHCCMPGQPAHLACVGAALVLCEVVGGHLTGAARLELLHALQQRRRVKRVRRVKTAAQGSIIMYKR